MSDSPYRPPSQHKPSTDESDSAVETPPLLPFAQLGLRLLGVLLIVDGLGALLGGLIQGLLQAQAYSDAGYSVPIDPHSAGWVAGGIPHLIAGTYLVVSGNWVLRSVLTSPRHQIVSPSKQDDIPKQRTS